jgi:Acyl-CoA carboxylase epsilon subunit
VSGDASYHSDWHSQVIHILGEPSDAELAALMTALFALANAGTAEPPAPRRTAWADPAQALRAPVHPGPGAWRASALPHSG